MHTYLEDAISKELFDYVIISLVLHEMNNTLADALLKEAKRLVKPNGKILVVEWEEPRGVLRNTAFSLIRYIEPEGFNIFLKQDFKLYFKERGLYLKQTSHYDYSRIFEIIKA